MENAGQACQKRWMLMFERQSRRKWHERKNSLQNKLTQARKSREMVIVEKRKKKKKGGIERNELMTALCCIQC